jgi:hypothetical protein
MKLCGVRRSSGDYQIIAHVLYAGARDPGHCQGQIVMTTLIALVLAAFWKTSYASQYSGAGRAKN